MKDPAFYILDFTASRGEQSSGLKRLGVDLRFVQGGRCLRGEGTKDPVLEILDFTAPRG
eukprot:NODE_1315_length_1178_cov_264.895815.p6 GENE.NODE_1315_length_1178_cov_264.895815~~NODE_1315_length_1178_cov_264.895815.p6  ORF type:complete len:59 (-),score=3.11 NODE_1315_length_1178_cov_264.895815:462-638(-)